MKVIKVRNVHDALPEAIDRLDKEGVVRDSRNGSVTMFPEPVTTVYTHPTERVLFHPARDANPFFHFFESLWMLGGRNDVAFPALFVNSMRGFSDDGKTFHGAYGHRWRVHFGFDQLASIAAILRENPDDRRCVLQMWDADADLGKDGRDFPCNTQIYLSRSLDGSLDMTVCCRSNDIVWGAYGANAVHMSYLQEYLAGWIGCPVGTYRQVSNNLHAYHKTLPKVQSLEPWTNPYALGQVEPYPMFKGATIEQINQDLHVFLTEGPIIGLVTPFFKRVVVPLWMAHKAYRDKSGAERYDTALEILQQCQATDWRRACEEWIERRRARWLRAGDDGVLHD